MPAGALSQVHMNVVLVIAVGAGAEHGREAGASAFPHALAKIFVRRRIGQLDDATAGELDRAYVERIGFAVLGEFCADDAVAAAAIIGCVVVDALERSPESAHRRPQLLPHPLHDSLGETA